MTTQKSEQKSRKPHVATLVVAGVIMALLVGLTIAFWQPLSQLFSDPDRARALVANAGPWGPLIFMGMQLAQVLVAPIPGQVTSFIGGLLFGWQLGFLYTMIGSALGFTLVFVLARKLGRPFVERFVDKKILQKFDYLIENNGTLVFFLIFLLPAFPDDLICYIAGLTTIKIRTLVLISLLGRMPGNLLLSLTGSGLAESNMQLVGIIVTIFAVVAAIGFTQRKRIERWVKRLSEKQKES